MYVNMRTCTHTCVGIRTLMLIYVHMRTYMYTYADTHTHANMYVRIAHYHNINNAKTDFDFVHIVVFLPEIAYFYAQVTTLVESDSNCL